MQRKPAEESDSQVKGPKAQKPQVLDFLYCDRERIHSFAAQLFAGRLSASEQSTAERSATEGTTEGNAAVFKASVKGTSDATETTKRVFDPHDRVITDVILELQKWGMIREDMEPASNGALVWLHGSIIFTDGSLIRAAMNAFAVPNMGGNSRADRNNAQLLKAGLKMLDSVDLPAAYWFTGEDHRTVSGSIKSQCLQESVYSYIYRHGGERLDGVHLLCIKEHSSPLGMVGAGESFLETTIPVASALRGMVLPASDYKATPLLVFRKIA